MSSDKPAMPLFLVKPKTISPDDIKRAQDECGICIVECSEPDAVRLMQPPFLSTMSDQSRAAMELTRWIVGGTNPANNVVSIGEMSKFFVRLLLDGNKPEPVREVGKVKK